MTFYSSLVVTLGKERDIMDEHASSNLLVDINFFGLRSNLLLDIYLFVDDQIRRRAHPHQPFY